MPRLPPTLFCLISTVCFTDQPQALQSFLVAVSSYTERCHAWLAVPVRTGETMQRSAHNAVATCRPWDVVYGLCCSISVSPLFGCQLKVAGSEFQICTNSYYHSVFLQPDPVWLM